MELKDVFAFLVGLAGFVLAAGLTVGVIFWVRQPLAQLLARLIRDETVAQAGTTFGLILLGLRGLSAMFGYITQPNCRESKITRLGRPKQAPRVKDNETGCQGY